MRLLVTADWHIGLKVNFSGSKAAIMRSARLDTVRRILDLARQEDVDAIVVAGDMFEDNAVSGVLVQELVDLLVQSPAPSFILPGNHDPLLPGCVYDREIWQTLNGVTVWRSREPQAFKSVVFYPCPVASKTSSVDPTGDIPGRLSHRSGIRVGVAHGSHLSHGAPSGEVEFPIASDAAEQLGLDALLIGHWHGTYRYGPPGFPQRTFYPGAPEQTRFGETNSGNVLIIDLEQGEPPAVKVQPVGKLQWQQWERTVFDQRGIEALYDEINALGPERSRLTLLEIVLKGVVPFKVIEVVEERIKPLLEARFLYSRVVMSDLLLEPTESEIRGLVDCGPVYAVYQELLAAVKGNRPLIDQKVAKQALLELYRLHKEA